MPPPDDPRNAILGEVQALRNELKHLDSRAQARDIKRRVMHLHARATTHSPGRGDPSGDIEEYASLSRMMDSFFSETRDVIERAFGTSAWDEPKIAEEMTAGMKPLPAAGNSDPLLVDAELAELEYRLHREADEDPAELSLKAPVIGAKLALKLVAEVRRLRSDTWVVNGIAESDGQLSLALDGADRGVVLDVLRKHRDGRG